MIVASQTSLSWYWLWHPLFGAGYQFFSGIGSSISEWFTIMLAISVYAYHHNCHEHRCLRLSWHADKDGHPVCKVHHPEHPSRGWLRTDRSHPRHAALKSLLRRRAKLVTQHNVAELKTTGIRP